MPDQANPQAFNRYSYCLNNPLKYTDPSGRVVMFFENDPNLISLVQAWKLFSVVDTDTSRQLMESTTVYAIGTNDFASDIPDNTILTNNDSVTFKSEKGLVVILIGLKTISNGIVSIAGTYTHENVHIQDAEPGATQNEEYLATWARYDFTRDPYIFSHYNYYESPPESTIGIWLKGSGEKYQTTPRLLTEELTRKWSDRDSYRAYDVYDLMEARFGNPYIYGGSALNNSWGDEWINTYES